MKKLLMTALVFAVLLAAPLFLRAYDLEPSTTKVIPECIWAAASGGGTWVTEIQITNRSKTEISGHINAYVYSGTEMWGPFQLTTSELARGLSLRFSNIMSSLDSRDTNAAHVYEGKVYAVRFVGLSSILINVTAFTKNGNYGKTFPGLNRNTNFVSAFNRFATIPYMTLSSSYRSAAGFVNLSVEHTYSVEFRLYNYDHSQIGATFTKTFAPHQYRTFNPFTEAGITSGTYTNAFLWLKADGGTDISEEYGIMGFGSVVNNTSNDPAAVLPYVDAE